MLMRFCKITVMGTMQKLYRPYNLPNKTALDLFSSLKFNEPKSNIRLLQGISRHLTVYECKCIRTFLVEQKKLVHIVHR